MPSVFLELLSGDRMASGSWATLLIRCLKLLGILQPAANYTEFTLNSDFLLRLAEDTYLYCHQICIISLRVIHRAATLGK